MKFYGTSVVVILVYDYFLTLGDEVAKFPIIMTQRGTCLNTLYRSVMRGHRRTFPVGKLSQFSWGAPTDCVSVLALYLVVSNLRLRNHTYPDRRLDQVPPNIALFVVMPQ